MKEAAAAAAASETDPTRTVVMPTAETHRSNYIGLLLKDRYRIVRELGKGGFSMVYLAHDEKLLSKPVVVKVLLTVRIDEWLLRKFQQEKEALARIDHPGVVAVLDEGETPENTPFLVMQFVDGATLRSLVRQGPMDFARAAEVFRQVGSALQAAHDKGIFHRDLKPENIMLQSSGNEDRVRLIDFGIAGIADSVYGQPSQSRVAGTLAYMPPEQVSGKVTAQTDIYAFGALAFEMLAGKRAVEDPVQLIALEPGALERKLQEARGDVPEAAAKAIARAMSKDPQQRFENAREMGDRLAEALRPMGSAPSEATYAAPVFDPDQLQVAHVLFLDIVKYSTLPMEEQRDLLRELQDLVRQTEHFLEAEKRRELVALPTGDGMALVFFGDPTVAAECSLEIARAIGDHPKLKLRMGLHIGPVYRVNDINKNLNVSGGGINLAQRVMDAGDAGHILLSSGMADVLTQVGRWRGWLTDFGEHEVKHGVRMRFYNLYTGDAGNQAWPSKWGKPAEPKKPSGLKWAIAAAAVALAAGGGWWGYQKFRKPEEKQTVTPAVLETKLSYYLEVKTPGKEPRRYAREIAFRQGDKIAVHVNTTEAGYLYILNDGVLPDGSPSINVLYPAPGANASIGPDQIVRIPQEGWIGLDQAGGTEKLYLVWSHSPAPEFERAKNQTDSVELGEVVIRAADQLGELRNSLEKYKITGPQIRPNEDTKASSLTTEKPVLVHLIRLEHE